MSAPSQGQRRDAYKRDNQHRTSSGQPAGKSGGLDDAGPVPILDSHRHHISLNPHDFPIRQHDTATGQRAIREAADYLELLGDSNGGYVAFLRSFAGGWSA